MKNNLANLSTKELENVNGGMASTTGALIGVGLAMEMARRKTLMPNNLIYRFPVATAICVGLMYAGSWIANVAVFAYEEFKKD